MLSLRADRLATLYLFHPLLKRVPATGQLRIPILMYHSISSGHEGNRHPYYQTETTPQIFALHMKFLYENAYSVVTLAEVARRIESGEQTTKKCIAITFDDGYRDFRTHAFPILDRYGFTATVFLPTGYIDDTRRRFKNRQCLTWKEARELCQAGILFGSHTVTHRQLRSASWDALEEEVQGSKEMIEDTLAVSVDSFSYPYAFPEEDGEFRKRLRDVLERSRYNNGVSTVVGTTGPDDDNFFLPRLPINSHDDLLLLQAKLEGGYDWLHTLQYASKVIKAKLL